VGGGMPQPNRTRPSRGKRENQGYPRGYAPITTLQPNRLKNLTRL
jgi:hypothetical protein